MQFQGEDRIINLELIEKLWPAFEERIPDNKAAVAFLLETLLVNSALHCHCGIIIQNRVKSKKKRTVMCSVCKKEIWITSSTLFRRVKQLKAWLGAIYLMGHGAVVTSNKLSELGGTAISTALNIVRKIGLVIEGERQQEAIDTSYKIASMEFVSIFCRRSMLTLPKVHPSIALEDAPSQEQDSESADDAQSPEADLSPNELEILHLLGTEPMTQDQICDLTKLSVSEVGGALVVLELEGLIEAHPGGRFSKKKAQKQANADAATMHTRNKEKDIYMPSMGALVGRVIDMTQSIRGGISRKYLQIYLASMWCQLDRARWNETSLLHAFIRSAEICYQDILDYESPTIVSIRA